ncbi:MAG: hypothetical protein MZV70_08955 [Desulfobacterales bacterium]|nr:hypothetical protein [Desulfobacterales bacterium]
MQQRHRVRPAGNSRPGRNRRRAINPCRAMVSSNQPVKPADGGATDSVRKR